MNTKKNEERREEERRGGGSRRTKKKKAREENDDDDDNSETIKMRMMTVMAAHKLRGAGLTSTIDASAMVPRPARR
mgnify:CR=1 FL=1